VSDVLAAVAPLGAIDAEGDWTPLAAGVLLEVDDLPWLVTAAAALEAAEGQPLGVWIPAAGLVVDLAGASRRAAGLDWLPDPAGALAAVPFPVADDWGLEPLGADRCLPAEALAAGLAVLAAGVPYPLAEAGPPPPLLLPGAVAGPDGAGGRYVTAPLLSDNTGAPLFAAPPGAAALALAGVLTGTVLLPESPGIPPVRLATATPIAVARALLASEPARALAARVPGGEG